MERARGPEHKAPPPPLEHKATESKAEGKTGGAAARALTPPPVLERQHGRYDARTSRRNRTGS